MLLAEFFAQLAGLVLLLSHKLAAAVSLYGSDKGGLLGSSVWQGVRAVGKELRGKAGR